MTEQEYDEQIAPLLAEVARKVAAMPSPDRPRVATTADEATLWTPEELGEAFLDLEDGVKMADVARKWGKSFNSLRGKWAARQRHLNKEKSTAVVPVAVPPVPAVPGDGKSPFEIAATAIEELNEQPECSVCGRPFTLSPDRQDRCARCSVGDLS